MSAEVMILKTNQLTPEEILGCVNTFNKASTHEISIGDEELTKTALTLLKNLPSSRQAVLEYLGSVYKEGVGEHLVHLDSGDSDGGRLDPIISDIQSVLINFIHNKPNSWAPLISSWAIDLLGRISHEYANHRNMPPASSLNSLNDLLLVWMTCRPSKSLVEIASECFTCLSGNSVYNCVDALLVTSVKHSPHFDWVVAHMGSCFPKTIVTRMLQCGLRDYYQNAGIGVQGQPLPASSGQPQSVNDNIPKIPSVVGILGYLTKQHSIEVRDAILTLFQESIQSDTQRDDMLQVAPMYLLYLASQSPVLLRALAENFISNVTPAMLNKLAEQLKAKKKSMGSLESAVNVTVRLLMTLDSGAFKIISMFINYAAPAGDQDGKMETDDQISPDVTLFCSLVLNWLILELQRLVNNRSCDSSLEINLLHKLKLHTLPLCQLMSESSGPRMKWLYRLLSCLAIHCSEHVAVNVLSGILVSVKDSVQVFIEQNCRHWKKPQDPINLYQLTRGIGLLPELSLFTQLQQDIQMKHSEVTFGTTEKVVAELSDNPKCQEFVVSNLLQLCRWEIEDISKNQTKRTSIIRPLQEHVEPLARLLMYKTSTTTSNVLKLLNLLGVSRKLDVSCLLRLSCKVVDHFFSSVYITDTTSKFESCQRCISYLAKVCSNSNSVQIATIRFLIENALSKDNAFLFGGAASTRACVKESQKESSLLSENNHISTTVTALVFHTGIIGSGLKTKPNVTQIDKVNITHNKQLLLEALCTVSCRPRNGNSTVDGCPPPIEECRLTPELTKAVALMLVEIVSPDVIYNERHWPDEDFIRVTVERDLVIRRTFEDNPILWDLLDFLATGPSGMFYCSCLLRGIMATLLTQWETSREKLARNLPVQLEISCRVLEYMRKGQTLPEPLCYTGDLLPFLTPYEVYLLLLNIWRYMKDIAPQPGQRLPAGCALRYNDIVHSIIQNNISQLGHLYPLFFRQNLTS